MFKPLLLVSLACTFFLSGCGANFNSVYRPLDTDTGKGALVDIKQRAIVTSKWIDPVPVEIIDPDDPKKRKTVIKEQSRVRVCAEPSPDALSAYAIQLAAEGKIPDGTSAKLGLSTQEASSFVGLRTQSIQVLRDSMYRICEAYMSGGITNSQYDIMLRRSQKFMVALLGIEQLTGVMKVPPVVINTSGNTQQSRPVTELREEVKKIDKEIADLKASIKADTTTEDKESINKDVEARVADKKILEDAIKNPTGMSTSGTARANVIVNSIPSSRSDSHVEAVAAIVAKIVNDVVNSDDTGQLCFSYLSKLEAPVAKNGVTKVPDTLETSCKAYFTNAINNLNNREVNQNNLDAINIQAYDRILKAAKTNDELKAAVAKAPSTSNGGPIIQRAGSIIQSR